jgi:hypothetical protein
MEAHFMGQHPVIIQTILVNGRRHDIVSILGKQVR